MTSTSTIADPPQPDGEDVRPAVSSARSRRAGAAKSTMIARINRYGVQLLAVGAVALIAAVAMMRFAPPAAPAPSLTKPAAVPLEGAGVPAGATTVTSDLGGQGVSLILPPTTPVGLAVFFHSTGADSTAVAAEERTASLVQAGWAVASSDFHGDSWGAPVATSDLLQLTAWTQEQTGLTPTLFVSLGMGALVSLNSLTRGVPAPACWYGIDATTDLKALEADPATAQQVANAYRERPLVLDNPLNNAPAIAATGAQFRFVGDDASSPGAVANSGGLVKALAGSGASVSVAEVGDAAAVAADLVDFAGGCTK